MPLPGPFPHPFNLYLRFSRIQLTDGLLDMVTLPSGNGWTPINLYKPWSWNEVLLQWAG